MLLTTDASGEWGLSRYQSGWHLVSVFRDGWDKALSGLVADLKMLLTELYVQGDAATRIGQAARWLGRLPIRGAGAIGAGAGLLALHAKCWSQYLGCRSGCEDCQ